MKYSIDTGQICIEAEMFDDLVSGEVIFQFRPEEGLRPEYFASISQNIVILVDLTNIDICYIDDTTILYYNMIAYGAYALVIFGWVSAVIGFIIKRLNGI